MAGDAKNAIISSAWKILSYEKVDLSGAITLSAEEVAKAQEFTLRDNPAATTSPTSPSPHNTLQFGRLLKIIFKKLLAEGDMPLISHLSYLPFTPGFEMDKGHMNQVLEDLLSYIQHVVAKNDTTGYLLSLKSVLCLLDDDSILQGAKIPVDYVGRIPASLAACAMLDIHDIKTMVEMTNAVQYMKIFEDISRPFPLFGTVTKCGKSEVAGKHVGMVANFTLDTYTPRYAYYEATIKTKDSNMHGVRIGWGFRNAAVDGLNYLGKKEDTFVIDLQVKRFLHNDGDLQIPESIAEAKGIEEKEVGLTANDIFGGLFGENDEVVEQGGDPVAAAPTLPSDVQDQAAVEPAVEPVYGHALRSASDEPVSFSVTNNAIVSSVLDLQTGQLLFYTNGVYAGCAPVVVSKENLKALVPVYSVGSAFTIDLNTGNSQFKHLLPVCNHLLGESDHDPTVLLNSINTGMKSASNCSSYLRLLQLDSILNPGCVFIPYLPSVDSTKTMTFEFSMLYNYKPTVVAEEYAVLTCGSTLNTTNPGSSCPNDRGCRISVTNKGMLCFETSGCDKYTSKADLIKSGIWYQVSIVYVYHRTTDKADLLFFLNGNLVEQSELVSKKNGKLGKLLPRSVCIHHNDAVATPYSIQLCDMRLWSAAKNQEKIIGHLGKSKVFGNEPDLILFLPMVEQTGDVLHYIYGSGVSRKVDEIKVLGSFDWGMVSDSGSSWPTLETIMGREDRLSSASRAELAHIQVDTSQFLDDMNLHCVASLLRVLLGRISKSCCKFGNNCSDGTVPQLLLKLLLGIPAPSAFICPTMSFFMLIVSILRHFVVIIDNQKISESKVSLYTALLHSVLKLIKVNIVAYLAYPEVYQTPASPVHEAVKHELFLQLCYIMRGLPSAQSTSNAILQNEAADILAEGLDFFVYDVEGKFDMLNLSLQLALLNQQHENKLPAELNRALNEFQQLPKLKFSFLLQDPLRAFFGLPDVVLPLLVKKLSFVLAKGSSLSTFVGPMLKPVSKMDKQTLSGSTVIDVYVGALVQRGADWRYEEEGGNDVGIVLAVVDWLAQSRAGVIVNWKNGAVDTYRYGFVTDSGQKIFDVEVLQLQIPKKNIKDVKSEVVQSKLKGVLPQRPLLYSPSEVFQALLEVRERAGITRRSIIQYMKEVSSNEWQVQKKISKPIHVVMKDITTLQLCSLYLEFSRLFSDALMEEPPLVRNVGEYFIALYNYSKRASTGSKVGMLIEYLLHYTSISLVKEGASAEEIQLLQSLQLLLCSDNTDSDSRQRVVCNYRINDFPASFTSGSSLYKWNWKLGIWISDEIKNAANEIAADSSVLNQQHRTFTEISIDSGKLLPQLQLRKRSRFVEVMCSGHREWYTLHTNESMPSSAGTFIWYVKVKNFNERKGHFMVGICTNKLHSDDFLGQDRDSMGLSQTLDFFFNGRKNKSTYDNVRLSTGTMIEIVYDSSVPSLSFVAITNDSDLYKRTIGKDVIGGTKGKTFHPAISLYSSGDCLAFVTESEDISYFQARAAVLLASEVSAEKKSAQQRGSPAFYGCPSDYMLHYFYCYTSIVKKSMESSSLASMIKLNPALAERFLGCYLHMLCVLHCWTVASPVESGRTMQVMIDLFSLLQTQLSMAFSTDMDIAIKESVLFFSYHLSCLLLANINKHIHLYIRYDQVLVYNSILDSARRPDPGPSSMPFMRSKQELLGVKGNKLFRNGLRHDSGSDEALLLSCSSTCHVGWKTLIHWLYIHDRHGKLRLLSDPQEPLTSIAVIAIAVCHHSGTLSVVSKLQDMIYARSQEFTTDEDTIKFLKSFRPPSFLSHLTVAMNAARSFIKDLIVLGYSKEKIDLHFYTVAAKLIQFFGCHNDQQLDDSAATLEIFLHHLQRDNVFIAAAEANSKEVSALVKGVMNCSETLVAMVDVAKGAEIVARHRKEGFKAMKNIMECLTSDIGGCMKSLAANDLRKVLKGKTLFVSPSASLGLLKEPHFVEWHYLNDLNGTSKQQVQEVQGAFSAIMSAFAAELASNCECGSEYQLLLLDTVAIRLHTIDHELLARMNIFYIIQELLEELNRPTGDAGPPTTSGDSPSSKRKEIVASAMKLFICLALQVALDQENSSNLLLHFASNRQVSHNRPYMELSKVKSGPATLSKAVFDIVYTLLSDITSATKFRKANSLSFISAGDISCLNVKEQHVIVDEAIGLLLCVSRNHECAKLLAKPKWLQLLLSVAAYGQGYCRSKCLVLLADLLPLASDVDLTFSLANAEHGRIFNSSACEAIYSLLILTGQVATSLDASHEGIDANTSFICESISVLRGLLKMPLWSGHVIATLELALNAPDQLDFNTMSPDVHALLGALIVIGGYWDHVYVGAYVLFRPGPMDEEHIGVVQSITEGDSKALVVGAVTSFLQQGGAEGASQSLETKTVLISSPLLGIAEKHSLSASLLSKSIWSSIVKLCGLFPPLMTSADSELEMGDGNGQHLFIACIAWFSSVKCLTKLLEDTSFSLSVIADCFDILDNCSVFLNRMLQCSIQPCIFGGMNEIGLYERTLAMVMQYYRKAARSSIPTQEELEVEKTSEAVSPKDVECDVKADSQGRLDEVFTPTEEVISVDAPVSAEEGLFPPEVVESLVGMGFSRDVCVLALTACHGDVEEALNYILMNGAALEGMAAAGRSLPPGSRSPQYSFSKPETTEDKEAESKIFHYSGDKKVLLPLFTEPRYDSDRIACVFPGDDIVVYEEQIVEGAVWYKVSYSDFDESNVQATYSEEIHSLYIWAPQVMGDEEVVRPGSCDSENDHDLADPPCELIVIDKYYRIIGGNGAMVRSGRETSSSEVMTILKGDVVHAHGETFNLDGTCRLQVDYPVNGWISKIFGLIELIQPDSSLLAKMQERIVQNEPASELKIEDKGGELRNNLLRLEDNLEVLTGTDAFSKEDRFFGHMQGVANVYFKPSESRKSDKVGAKGFRFSHFRNSLIDVCTNSSKVDADRFTYCLLPLCRLYARKLMLIMLLKANNSSDGDILKLLEYSEATWNANSIVALVRMGLYRGDPTAAYGFEISHMVAFQRIAAMSSSITLEEILFLTMTKLISSSHEIHCASVDTLNSQFFHLFLTNIVHACSLKYSDHSWVDTSYNDDVDAELDKLPNVHVAQWIALLFAELKAVNRTLDVLDSLLLSLKATSMSLKMIVCRTISTILVALRSWSLDKDQFARLGLVLSNLSLTRLKKFGSRRLWQEKEDSPSFSRFFQAYVDFVAQFELTLQHCSSGNLQKCTEVTTGGGKDVLSFNNSASHVTLLPAKELAGSWTLELWLQRKHCYDDVYEGDVKPSSPEKDTTDSAEKLSFGTIMQMLLGTPRQELDRSNEQAASEIATEGIVEATAETCKASFVHPSYLLSSSKFFIKVQRGGRRFSDIDDPFQESDCVPVESQCVSIGQVGSDQEKTFSFSLPYEEWMHLAFVQDSVNGIISLYVNGSHKDSISCSIALPLHTVGSSKPNETFSGNIAEMRVWSYARSGGEITRDMHRHVLGYPLLVSLITFERNADGIVNDKQGCFAASKAVSCEFIAVELPLIPVPPVASDLVGHDKYDSNLTGILTLNNAQGLKGSLAKGLRDIVSFSYSLSPGNSDFSQARKVHGLMEWCDRAVKVSMSGTISESDEVEIFSDGQVVSGPPEQLSWLHSLKLCGKLVGGKLEGNVEMMVDAEAVPPVSPGRMRVDTSLLPSEIIHSSGGGRETLIVKDVSDGQYIAFFEVASHKPWYLESDRLDSFPYGITVNQGSLWFEWTINSNAGNIAFGFCSHSALTHPDASVDANDGTWTYSTSGQASHGANLYLCETADEGDSISAQINTDKGYICFYKNNEMVVYFDNINDDSSLQLNKEDSSQCGIRPFVSLCCSGDSITSLPPRKGSIEILYQESDAQQRGKFLCTLHEGSFSGFGLLGLYKNTEWWFGPYQADNPADVHLKVENIHSTEVVFIAARRYDNGACEDISLDSCSTVLSQYAKEFKSFRAERLAISGSLFSSSTTPTPVVAEEQKEATVDAEESSKIEVVIESVNEQTAVYSVRNDALLRTACEAFALRSDVPVETFEFKYNETVLDIDLTYQQLSLPPNAYIHASGRVFRGNYSETDDLVEKFLPNSSAKYIVQIVYEPGATVRNGIEIEGSSALMTLHLGEISEAFQYSFTSEGIKRYRTGNGWISDRLRGGTEAKVVRMLQEKLETKNTFKVKRSDGIKRRAKASMQSEDLGFIPKDTVITVSKRRLVAEGSSGEESSIVPRLYVTHPEEYAGWISDKPQLIEECTSPEEIQRDQNKLVEQELLRRSKIRALRKAKAALLESDKKYTKRVSLVASMSLSSETLFLWKRSSINEGVSISNDHMTATCAQQSGSRYLILGSRGFTQGIHYWEVTVKAASWGSVFIGVAPEEASGWHGLGFINYRATQAFGGETIYGSYYGVNDKIGVLLNMENGTLTFFKDGDDFNVGAVRVVNMGVAYHNVRRHTGRYSTSPILYPCIGMKAQNDELTIKNGHWHCLKGSSSQEMMEDIICHFSLVHTWRNSYIGSAKWDEDMLQRMYFNYQHSVQSTVFPTTSRAGLDVNINCAPSALHTCMNIDTISAHNLSVGCRVTTVYGVATILGVTDNRRIWYSCERNGQKAWYWLADELTEQLESGAIKREAVGEFSPLPLFPQESVTKNVVSFDDFRDLLVNSPWRQEDDELLVNHINKLANQFDQEPTKFSYQQLQALCTIVLADKHLSKKSKVEIKVRFAAICSFNQAVGKLLPYIDFNDAGVRKRVTEARVSGIEDFNSNCTVLKSTASALYKSLKTVVFTSTKLSFWQHVVDETTVSTNPPADEYERPDEIREISINRIQARNALKKYIHKDASSAERLRLSVFGQLMEHMNAWDARSLRRSYVHMQDAGQARCFFVKCQGEGVDDQGGPYRAVFQQAFEESSALLNLVSPVPNALTEIGGHRDKFLFSVPPSRKALEHFGKLVGIAVRHRILLPVNFAMWVWKALAGEGVGMEEVRQIDVSYINSLEMIASMPVEESMQDVVELLGQALHQNNASSALPLTLHGCNTLVSSLLSSPSTTASASWDSVITLIHFLRLHCQDDALEVFFKGVGQVLPSELLPLFTPAELEIVFCGERDVDLSVLKKVAVYDNVSPNDP